MAGHPPKPRLTVRVGITGHRPNKLDAAALPRIARQLRLTYAAIEAAAAEILKANEEVYASEAPAIRLVSGFAEGADQMAVAAAPAHWQVEAILPFPKDEYSRDFAKSASGDGSDVRNTFLESLQRASAVTELPFPRSGKRSDGYVNAGGYLLRQIDLIVAVWDGNPPKSGGTGEVTRKAFEGGIPIVWISSTQDRVPRLVTGFDKEGDPIAPDADCTVGPLANALAPVFAAPGSDERHVPRVSARRRLNRYLRERWRPRCYFTAYDLLKRLANGHPPRLVIRSEPVEVRSREWEDFLKDAPEADNLRERLRLILLPRFIWADALAVHFSHAYRSAYVLTYFLSALAVFIALFGSFAEWASDPLLFKATFVVLELAVIAAIIAIVWVGRTFYWHERWLAYRALAESLRHGRFLAFVSEFGRIRDAPRKSGDKEPPWILWYIRATMREIGLPTAAIEGTYQWRLFNATLAHEIMEQIKYHRDNSDSTHRLDHRLHEVGIACFTVTAVVLSAFTLTYGYGYLFGDLAHVGPHKTGLGAQLEFLRPWVTFVAAGLPALGAAFAGVRVQGDFEGSKERSVHMVNALLALEEDYSKVKNRDIGLEETAETMIATARVMSEDLAAWQDLYGRKRLSLPA